MKYILGFLACLIIVVLYHAVGIAVFGWKHGGGAIPMLVLMAAVISTWRAITGNRKIQGNQLDESCSSHSGSVPTHEVASSSRIQPKVELQVYVKPPYEPQRCLSLDVVNLKLRSGDLCGGEPAWIKGLPDWTRLDAIDGVIVPEHPLRTEGASMSREVRLDVPPPFTGRLLPSNSVGTDSQAPLEGTALHCDGAPIGRPYRKLGLLFSLGVFCFLVFLGLIDRRTQAPFSGQTNTRAAANTKEVLTPSLSQGESPGGPTPNSKKSGLSDENIVQEPSPSELTVKLQRGVSIEIPKEWSVLSGGRKKDLDTVVNSKLSASANSFQELSDLSFAANLFDDNHKTIAILNVRYYPEEEIAQEDVLAATPEEIIEVDTMLRSGITESGKAAGFIVKTWLGTRKVDINGVLVLLTEYCKISEIQGDEFRVRLVRVLSGENSFTLTVSYKMAESSKLEPMTDRIIDSIRVDNLK